MKFLQFFIKKYQLHFLLLIFIDIILYSCSDSESVTKSNGFAPNDVFGKEFCFYSNPPRWSMRMISGSVPTESLVLVNSETAMISKSAVYYKKKGNNTASINCNFWANIFIGGNIVGSYHEYDLQLFFTSPNQGYYTGTYFNKPDSKEKESTAGYFSFDTEQLPDFDVIPGDGSGNNPDIDNELDKDLFVIYEDIDLLSLGTDYHDKKYGAEVVSTFEYSDGFNHISAILGINTGFWYDKAKQIGWAFCVGTDSNVTRNNALYIADIFDSNKTYCRLKFYTPNTIKNIYIRPFIIENDKIYYFKARKFLTRPGGVDLQLIDTNTDNLILNYKLEDNNVYSVNISYGDKFGNSYYDEFVSINGGCGKLMIPLPIIRQNLESLSVYLVNHKDEIKYRTKILFF